MYERKNPVVGLFRGIWQTIDTSRKVAVNLLFLAIVIALIAVALSDRGPEIADTTALVIAPRGQLVEQLSAKSVEQIVDEARGAAVDETLVKDVVDAIEAGKNDDRIAVLVLDLRSFAGARLTKLQDVGAAIDDFRTSGKKVVAMSDEYGQDAYYLAAHADEVLVHAMGMVVLEGFGRYRMYYKEGIDKLGLDVHIFKVGTYKSAVEPYLRDNMSEYAREANEEWLGDLWRIYLDDVAAARGTTPERLEEYAQDTGRFITEANGDTARAAVDFGLVDAAMTRVEMRQHLIELVGENEKTHSYNRVAFADYLETLDDDRFGADAKGDRVGIVVARGVILDGSQPAGTIGGDSTAALIRQARNDDDVKAIVLRVDSGGGSAFASEVIRRECEAARADGKPVIASMGSVAASGGYWISTSSDEIWAYPSTITGSIGIFGMIPTYQRPLADILGIHVDGIGTTPLTGVRLDRELPPEVGVIIQEVIEHGYQEFLTRVAESRGMTTDEVDLVAQGRVWSGIDAYELGLVDHLGDLDDAVAAAAALAELGDDYTVTYVEKEESFKDKIVRQMLARAAALAGQDPTAASPLDELVRSIERSVRDVAVLNDPNHAYALSNIETD